MSKNWINTSSDDDAQERIREYWDEMRSDLNDGEFWADKIKEYKDKPEALVSLYLHRGSNALVFDRFFKLFR